MMHCKNNKAGFTLVEVMLTMMIMGMLMTPLYLSESAALISVSKANDMVNAITEARLYLHEMEQAIYEKKNPSKSKTSADGAITLHYTEEKVTGTLAKKCKGTKKLMVTATWQRDGRKQETSLVTFLYAPEDEEKKQ